MSTNGDHAPPRAQLLIVITAAGEIQVTGPFHDKVTCYAMLEVARDTVKEQYDLHAKSKIVPATPGDVPHLTLKS